MFKLTLIIAILSVFLACGKEPRNSDKKNNRSNSRNSQNDTSVDLNQLMLKQEFTCSDLRDCPDNIARILIKDGDKIRSCVGVLIRGDQLLTSSSCLSRRMRTPKFNCSNNIFAVFPKSKNKEMEIAECSFVMHADQNTFENYPALWKNDLSVLKLKKAASRTIGILDPTGINLDETYSVWKIKTKDKFRASIHRDECRTIKKSYLNPFSDNKFSGMYVASACRLDHLVSGAVMFEGFNRIKGIFSKVMNKKLTDYLEESDLLAEKLDEYYHFSNTACTKYSPWRGGSRSVPSKCLEDFTFKKLDQFRSNFFDNIRIHKEEMQRIEEDIENRTDYFKWNVSFHHNRDKNYFEAHIDSARCIYNSDNWIGNYRSGRGGRWISTFASVELELPNYRFYNKLNRELKSVSILEDRELKIYEFEFNPYNAHVLKKTNLKILSKVFGRDNVRSIKSVDANCL